MFSYLLPRPAVCSIPIFKATDAAVPNQPITRIQVVSFAGELLKKAEDLLHTGLHTSEIVAGYKAAFEQAMEILPTLTVHTVRSPLRAPSLA